MLKNSSCECVSAPSDARYQHASCASTLKLTLHTNVNEYRYIHIVWAVESGPPHGRYQDMTMLGTNFENLVTFLEIRTNPSKLRCKVKAKVQTENI